MTTVKVHSGCIGQANVALRRAEPPAPRCRCKKKIDYQDANLLVRQGTAKWVVTNRTRGSAEVDCSFCAAMTDVQKKSCPNCKGTGKVIENKIWEDFNNDIVLLGDDKEGFKEKTPRVATIEENHIEGAYIGNDNGPIPYVLERIKEYASMIQEALAEFGAQLKDGSTNDIIFPGNVEPADKVVSYPPGAITFADGTKNKSWYWKVEGRRFDYGRAV